MLGNMSGVSVNCVSFHQCAMDCVSEGKVLGIESHLDVALALGVAMLSGKGQSVFVCNISCNVLHVTELS